MPIKAKPGKLERIEKQIADLEARRSKEFERLAKAKREIAERLASNIGRAFLEDADPNTRQLIQTVLLRSRAIKPREIDFLVENGFLYPTWTPPNDTEEPSP